MFRPTPAATSRVRSPSKPRSAIWLNAAWTSACWRSSLRERTGCVVVAGVISLSIKHLIDIYCADGARCYAPDQEEVDNVQPITRGGDASGAGSRAGESVLSRQAGVDAKPRHGRRRRHLPARGWRRLCLVCHQWEALG